MAGETFKVSVDGIGDFTFRHRTQRDSFRILGNAERMTGGPVIGARLWEVAMQFSAVEVLAVDVPEGWDTAALDPFVNEDIERVGAVYARLTEQEATFRKGSGAKRAGAGAATP